LILSAEHRTVVQKHGSRDVIRISRKIGKISSVFLNMLLPCCQSFALISKKSKVFLQK
jgi:hypothetical protein